MSYAFFGVRRQKSRPKENAAERRESSESKWKMIVFWPPERRKKKRKGKKYITRTTAVFGRPIRPGQSEPYLKNVVLPMRGNKNPRTYIDDRPVVVSRSFSFYCALFFLYLFSLPQTPTTLSRRRLWTRRAYCFYKDVSSTFPPFTSAVPSRSSDHRASSYYSSDFFEIMFSQNITHYPRFIGEINFVVIYVPTRQNRASPGLIEKF